MAAFQRILLTGGAGFVGAHLAAALAQAYPHAEKSMLMRPGETGAHPAFATTFADLLDEAAIERLVAETRPDLVAHLAGQASAAQAARAAEQTWRVNFHGAFNLAAALARHAPAATVLFASSAMVYGASFRDGVLTEDAPLRPLDSYSRSKAAAESAFADVLGEEARLIVARPVNHSGPGQRSGNFVLSSFAAQIVAIESKRDKGPLRVGDLSKARDFLDVRDVIDAYVRLIAAAPGLPERVSVFNVASGEARSIGALLDEMRALSGVRFDIEVEARRLRPATIDIESIACDASRLRRATGWRPLHPLSETMGALLDEKRAEAAGGGA